MSEKMETIKELMERTGLHYGVVRYRMKKRNIKKRYTNIPNQAPMRIFNVEEVREIEFYQAGTPGRPWKKKVDK